MDNKIKNAVTVLLCGGMVAVLSLLSWFWPEEEFSESERRYLASFPTVSAKAVLSGSFMQDFDKYTTDRFPMRDGFRAVKAASVNALGMLDNGGIYYWQGHIGKLLYPMRGDMLQYAAELYTDLYRENIEGTNCNVYLAVVPDKNRYLAPEAGRLHQDYDAASLLLQQGMPWAEYIEIADLLSADSYYSTDTHWKQQELEPVARRLQEAMGVFAPTDYTQKLLDSEFYGVLQAQGALPHPPDSIICLESPETKAAKAFDHEGEELPLYDLEKLSSADHYEVFLSGVQPLITIQNPLCQSGRELVVIRDSYGSSLAPLLLPGYSKLTLVDLRYIRASALGEYLSFTDQDVLFLPSNLILDGAIAMQ